MSAFPKTDAAFARLAAKLGLLVRLLLNFVLWSVAERVAQGANALARRAGDRLVLAREELKALDR